MILTVTLNAALDVTYQVPRLTPHTTHRVSAVAERAGGKGINVARLLHALGEPVTATGLVGGHTGERITDLLAADGVPAAFSGLAGESRRTVAVRSDGDATGFWEPGPRVSATEWTAFTDRFRQLLGDAEVVVLSGSLPRELPAESYGQLVNAARLAGVPVVLDADGEPLRHGLAARPTVVKPNADELAAVIGHRPDGVPETRDAARRLRDQSGAAVLASLGAAGLLAVTGDGAWHAAAPPQQGNPTGAGDAVVAALARGLRHRHGWPDLLVDATALSAAAVRAPVAGTADPDHYAALAAEITLTDLEG